MATIPNPRTWGTSEQVTAAKLNADIRDSFNFYKAPPLARLRKSGDQFINNNTATAVTWDFEMFDRDSGHSNITNNSRYTAQTAGWYHLSANLQYEHIVDKFVWADAYFRKNGSTIQNRSICITNEPFFYLTHIIEGYMQLNVNDYVEVVVHLLLAPGNDNKVRASESNTFSEFAIRWVTA